MNVSRRSATLAPAAAVFVAALAFAAASVAQVADPHRGTAAAPGSTVGAPTRDAAGADGFVGIEGDRIAGQRAASGGTAAGPGAACFNCHGIRGAGDGTGAFPRLAGQAAYYLFKQLSNYADGTRPNEVMTPIAVQMTERERRDVAVYYATLQAPFRTPAGLDPGRVQRGGTLAAVGSASLGLQACAGCHGPNGIGMPPDVPYLAGQGPGYLALQLRLWHEGTRRNDPLGVMADVARRLSDEDRQAVAAYFASLQPPGR
jgi:cytochrome c553